jgi:hypothetical protein
MRPVSIHVTKSGGKRQMVQDVLIRNARPYGGKPTDLYIRDGQFADASSPAAAIEIDAAGQIALPGFVEAHTHLDKTLIGMDWYCNRVGPPRNDRVLAAPFLPRKPMGRCGDTTPRKIKALHVKMRAASAHFVLTPYRNVENRPRRAGYLAIANIADFAFPGIGSTLASLRPGILSLLLLMAHAYREQAERPTGLRLDRNGVVDEVDLDHHPRRAEAGIEGT